MLNAKNRLMALITLSLAGCTTVPVLEEARPIQLYFNSPDLSACQFRGEVVGSQGSWYDFWLTSDPDLVNGAFNEIKNDALSKQANVVSMVPPIAFGTSVTFFGQAYDCPQNILESLRSGS
jgi:cytochrome P450